MLIGRQVSRDRLLGVSLSNQFQGRGQKTLTTKAQRDPRPASLANIQTVLTLPRTALILTALTLLPLPVPYSPPLPPKGNGWSQKRYLPLVRLTYHGSSSFVEQKIRPVTSKRRKAEEKIIAIKKVCERV